MGRNQAPAIKTFPGLEAGQQLGRFALQAVLGSGGYATVYRAEDTQLHRSVAIKLLDLGSEQFLAEARAVARLRHPNIVTLYEVGESPAGQPYLVMELLNGTPLSRLLSEHRPLPPTQAVRGLAQLASALDYLHSEGVVHRDLKPANVMVDEPGDFVLMDFGIARLLADEQRVTSAGSVAGTPAYMAPEQCLGEPGGPAADIYSLGIVAYEVLAGRVPFAGSTLTVMGGHLNSRPPSLLQFNPTLPAAVTEAVEAALAKDPAARPPTATDFVRGLARSMSVSIPTTIPTSALPRRGGPSSEVDAGDTGRRHYNLPIQLTGFVGRKEEAATVRALLSRVDVRLLTLTGPGGVGKTRLALAVADELAHAFEEGVVFVPLAPVRDPALVCSAIAQALDVREAPGRPLVEQVKDYLREKELLLLLDNFEHVAAAAPLAAELLTACGRLKALVTSRAVLRLYGEHDVLVPPLGLPDSSRLGAEPEIFAAAGGSDAVQLFVTRARAAQHEFALTVENAAAVMEICRRLDGLPLAIELASAWIRLLPPVALLQRLKRRLDLLSVGARDLPVRQQTLRGAIGWSYDLLTPAEQRLFRRLTVFVGGCSLEAAEMVAGNEQRATGRTRANLSPRPSTWLPRWWTRASCTRLSCRPASRVCGCWRRCASTGSGNCWRVGRWQRFSTGTPAIS